MAKFTRLEVAAKMAETGMVPLFYHSDIKIAKKAALIASNFLQNKNLIFKSSYRDAEIKYKLQKFTSLSEN